MPIRDDKIGSAASISNKRPNEKANTQTNKKNTKKSGENTGKTTTYNVSGVIQTLTAGQDNPVNKLTSDLVGATFTITNPHTRISSKYSDTRYTKPETYSTTISNVINETSFEVEEPYYVTDTKTNKKIPVSLLDADVSITYDTFKTITENTTFNRSYANMTIGNLRTFSGDVYKAKIYTREHGTSTDYEEIYENYVIPENQLVDTTSITGYDNIGFFHTGSIVSNNWVSSSTATQASPFVTLNNEKLIDGLEISGSVTGLNEIVEFSTKNHNTLEKGVDYVVRFNTYYFKSISERKDNNDNVINENYASLKVYLSGSAISGVDEDDFFLGEVDIPDSAAQEGEIKNVIAQFTSAKTGSPRTHLKFELHSGKFIIQDVSIEPFSETNFNPSFFNVLTPMPKPVRRGDKYDFLVEFYDSNNNLAETSTETLGVVFEGPRQIIADGLDAKLTGSMLVGESIELYGTNPAYIKSVGYQGFAHTVANNKGGFLLYSGSIGNGAPENRLTASEAYQGVGLEIVDAHGAGTGGDRYLKFKTNAADEDSEFEIVTDTFLFGISGSTNNYISGSNGKLEISSSNFELNGATGNVILQGTITAEAGGTIGGFTVSSSALAGENIFISGSPVAGGTDDSKNMFISTSKFNVKENGDITGSAVLFDGGKIAAWNVNDKRLSSFTTSTQDKFGISIDADYQLITVHGDSGEGKNNIGDNDRDNVRLAIGQLTDDEFGIKGFTTAGNRAFELSSTRNEIAGWTFDNEKISSNNLVINSSGLIKTDNYIPNQRGFKLSAENNGILEVEEARIRGTLKTTVFDKDTINAVGGQLHIANSTTITGSAQVGTGDTLIQVANSSGFTVGEFILAKKFNSSGFTTEIMKITGVSHDDAGHATNRSGSLTVLRAQGTSDPGTNSPQGIPDEAVLLGVTGGTGASAQTYEPGQVLVSTGKQNTGYIRLNANPNDTTTPYIDIIERNGTGVYDMDLKARLGDLSGLSSGLVGSSPGFGLFSENVFLTGKITATSGKIGEFNIGETASGTNLGVLFSDSNELVITGSTGQITGSKVLFDGGKIGGFEIVSDGLNSINNSFQVTGSTGQMTASNAKIEGNITATSGQIGNWDIIGDTLSSVNASDKGIVIDADNSKPIITVKESNNNLIEIYHENGQNFGIKGISGSDGLGSSATIFRLGDTNQIAGWSFDETTLSKLDSDNRGLVFNSSTPSLLIQSQSNGATHGEVRITANPQGGIANQKAASIVVSQSQIPIFSVGGDDFSFTSKFNAIMGSVPIQEEEQFTQNQSFGGESFPAFAEQTFENSSDTNTNTAGGGAPTVKASNLLVGSSLSASRFSAGSNIFLKNTRPSSSHDTKFHVLINDPESTGSAEPPVNINFDVRKAYADGDVENSDHIRQSVGFSTILSSADADTRFIKNGETTGSAIYHYFTRLEETANNKWADGKFAMMRLDVDTADLQQVEHRKEFVFLEMRESTGSAANTANDTNGRPNKRVFQVQASGSVVAAGNITAFGTTFMNVSDERLKENIYDVSGSLNKILDLRPTHFTWKENQKQDVGFIAQEVEEIIPEVVETSQGFIDTDGEEKNDIQDMKTISYPKLVPYLVDTIQELTKRIKELEKKVK